MDVQDVSGESWLVPMLRQWEQSAMRSQQTKGQRVRDHPPASLLVSQFVMRLRMEPRKLEEMPGSMATSQLPPPYPPCVLPIDELEHIAISDMQLETHHRGKKTVLRILTPPRRMTAVMAIAQDEKETAAVLLQLYHQPVESVVPAEEIMQFGDVFLLKEPFFKTATDGSYTLRVDHLGDIVRLSSNDGLVPSQWRKHMPISRLSSKDIRIQGNEAVHNEKWAAAHRLYTSAIQTAENLEDEQLAYLNRSLANMKLGRPAKALSDAQRGHNSSAPSEKGLFREARALYELGSFDQALETFERLIASYPQNPAAKSELQRVNSRLREQQMGAYSFGQMHKQAQKTPPLIDCATFSAPVEVRPTPGKGNGLFTTKSVSAGQLLLCEKAFGYSHVGEDPNASTSVLVNMVTKKGVMGGQVRLLNDLIQKIYHDPRAQKSCHHLYAGDYQVPSVSEVDGQPVIDSFLVAQIQSLNNFGAPVSSLDHLLKRTAGDDGGQRTAQGGRFATCGIWLLASRVNHSCVGNCRRSFIGDMQIIRATRDLEANTELVFAYHAPQNLQSYAEAQERLKPWGFTCTCELCRGRKETSHKSLARRKALTEKLSKALGGCQGTNIPAAQRILSQMEETYPPNFPGAVRLELWDPYFALGSVFLSEGKPRECIRAIVRGLETLGFGITANIPTGSKKAALEVTRWGYMTDMTPWAFLQLHRAYQALDPGVCVATRMYAGIAYRVLVGEDETLGDKMSQFM